MFRCCEGETYVLPNAPRDVTDGFAASAELRGRGRSIGVREPVREGDYERRLSWVVCCFDCDAVLAVVDGVSREEVYAEL